MKHTAFIPAFFFCFVPALAAAQQTPPREASADAAEAEPDPDTGSPVSTSAAVTSDGPARADAPVEDPSKAVTDEPAPDAVGPELDGGSVDVASTDTAHRHEGFYFSGSLGGGTRMMKSEFGGSVGTFSGTGGGFAAHIGGSIGENLILHATLTSSLTAEPEYEAAVGRVELEDTELVFVGVGPGVTYYAMPANVYVGASVLLARVDVYVDGDAIAESENGAGLALRIGKELWVSDETALGFGAQLFGAAVAGEVSTEKLTLGAFNVFFNATYD